MKFFVYGSLKKGFHNHPVIEGANYLGTFDTPKNYTMYSMGSYPAVTLGGETSIHGEVYETDNQHIINRLNRLEGYSGTPTKEGGHNFYDLETINSPYGQLNMFVIRDIGHYSRAIVKSGKW